MIEFNKTLKNNRREACNEPSIIFRELEPLNGKRRYQAFLNKASVKLAKEINPLYDYLQVCYSDEHLIIGLSPVGENSKNSKYIGVTGLMDLFDLKFKKHYEIKSNVSHLYFNSAQKE